MTNPSKALAAAKAEVGYHEGKSGGHWNNKQKFSGAVPGLEWSDYQAWCATFVSWCALQGGVADLYPRTASCAAGVAWFKARKRWSEYPAVGAQIFFGPGGGSHTGIVVSYDATYVHTIEGNTNTNGSAEGDGVYAKTRTRRDSYVYGYGYPEFTEGIKSADPTWKNPAVPVTNTPTSKEDDMPDAKDVWSYKNTTQGEKSDAYAYLRNTKAKVDAIEAKLNALIKAVEALSKAA